MSPLRLLIFIFKQLCQSRSLNSPNPVFYQPVVGPFLPFCGEITSPFSLAMSCTGGNLWFFHSFFFSFFLSLSLSLWSKERRKGQIFFFKCRYKAEKHYWRTNISTCIFSPSGPNKYWGLRFIELCNVPLIMRSRYCWVEVWMGCFGAGRDGGWRCSYLSGLFSCRRSPSLYGS